MFKPKKKVGVEIVRTESRGLYRSHNQEWPTMDMAPHMRFRRDGTLVIREPRKRKPRPKQKRLGLSQLAAAHGWNRWSQPFLQCFSTMHMRVLPQHGQAYGRGVQGAFGKIVGDPTQEK